MVTKETKVLCTIPKKRGSVQKTLTYMANIRKVLCVFLALLCG